MDREGGNRQRMRKSWEWISLSISSFSLHFLFISSFSLHFLAARLQGCHNLCNYYGTMGSIRRALVEPFLPNYHMDWVVLGFRWVGGWVPLTPTMCVIPPSYQALSGSYPNHQTSSSAGESQVRPPLTAYQVRVCENNLHSGHITIALQLHPTSGKCPKFLKNLASKNLGSKQNGTQKA